MFKNLLLLPAVGLARTLRALTGVRRIWAFASLQAALRTRVPRSTVILAPPEVHGTGAISLGESLYLYPGLYLETQQAGEIQLGDGVVLSRGVHLVAFAGITVGAGTMIGEYSSVRDANHRFGPDISLRYSGYDANPVHIGANVWIGRGVTVLPGVSIGDNAVIGANAVVTHNVPAGNVVAGVPARPIRRREEAA